jgi:hypothetical protein
MDLQVRCAIVEHPAAWLLFGVVGPSPGLDAEAEAINRRTWELAIETFRLD